MADIVERLRDKLPMVHDGEGMIVDDDAVLDTLSKAADEIERLREALSMIAEGDAEIVKLEGGVNLLKAGPWGLIARAGLGEKE